MADVDPAGTSSTPSTAASVADPATTVANPATTATAPVIAGGTPDPKATTPAVAVDPAAFALPTDLTINPEAVTKFQTALKGKVVDGKLNLSAQDVVNLYAEQARDANARWQQSQVQQDAAWEAASKQRFTPAQLAAAEVGIGFLTSKQLAANEKAGIKDATPFRDLAKGFKNHPDFVQVMQIVGDSLNEDTFERGSTTPAGKKTAAQRMYPNAKPS
jgi:hypothetical protein